ncbi:MAG: hypothetical protein FRX49_02915 [Trebouxia sp. A1-2]|nr:MAG: hypothetical protein FRX49_02915 [Trebouxia sp. A1-2]
MSRVEQESSGRAQKEQAAPAMGPGTGRDGRAVNVSGGAFLEGQAGLLDLPKGAHQRSECGPEGLQGCLAGQRCLSLPRRRPWASRISDSESRGRGPAMLAGRDRSYSSSCLLPPLLSLLMNPCSRPTLGGGAATCKQAAPPRIASTAPSSPKFRSEMSESAWETSALTGLTTAAPECCKRDDDASSF